MNILAEVEKVNLTGWNMVEIVFLLGVMFVITIFIGLSSGGESD